jgi:hypothetical protein
MFHRTKFAAWGLASYSAIGVGIGLAVVSAIRRSMNDGRSISFALILIAAGFVAGWIALYYGRQLKCETCQASLLPADSFGFQGLRFGTVVLALRGQLRCPTCAVRV